MFLCVRDSILTNAALLIDVLAMAGEWYHIIHEESS